jgi:hypothetical protein
LTTTASALAAWLHPALWLTLPALLMGGGAEGLWVGLLAVVGPLVARGRPASSLPRRASLVAAAVLVVAVAMLFWANFALAGDVALWLGRPRWEGVAVAAGGGLLLAVLPGGGRIAAALALLALGALAVSATVLVQASEAGPLEAWNRVASRAAFRFSTSSPWVTTGRALDRVAPNGAGLVFDEEHRVAAASAGVLRVRTQDGARISHRELEMGPGQSITLRPGDRLEAASGVRVRFEAGRRVPGAPTSGAAWARAGAPDLVARLGLGLTLLGGAVAVLRPRRWPPRAAALLGGAVLLAVLLWAEAWAVYGALTVPELLLAGNGLARVLDLPGLALGEGPGEPYLTLLVIGALASFLASTVGLRAAVARLSDSPRAVVREAGLWAAVFAVSGALALWPADPWALTLLALGLAASAVAPILLVPARPGSARGPLGAGLIGLALFIALTLFGRLGDVPPDIGRLVAYPALIALPAAVVLGRLWR